MFFFICDTIIFMNIKRAEILGFCFGVRRAVNLAVSALKDNQGKKIYSLGPLIHNEAALAALEAKGLHIIEPDQLNLLDKDCVVIIRAHGVSPEIINKIKAKNCLIIDATCPRVKASQKTVERYSYGNDYVILTGDKNHGEVIGIAGYAGPNYLQLQNSTEAAELKVPFNQEKNFILLSQTTYSLNEFEEIKKILAGKIKNLDIMNTICPATKERQEALLELCTQVDGVLVIGGKKSANTIRLFQTAQKNCTVAAHIQTAAEIPEEFYKLKTVGITAGASTPDELIEDVEKALMLK